MWLLPDRPKKQTSIVNLLILTKLFSKIHYLLGMLLILWPQKDLAYNTLLIYHKSGAVYSHIFITKHLLFAPYPIFIYDGMISIGQQYKWQIEFRFELLVAFFIVRTNPYYFKPVLCQ